MTTSITLAGPDALDRVLSLVERNHAEIGIASDDEGRRRAVTPLLNGSPHGAIWLIGPQRAPLGYVLVTFGWSIALGGMEGWVDETFIRQSVRRRGIGTEVLHSVAVALGQGDVKALHARLPNPDPSLIAFCERVGFRQRDGLLVMTDTL